MNPPEPIFSFKLVPGRWYIVVTCHQCKAEHVLFPDLSEGKSDLNAIYRWKCKSCGFRDEYDGDELKRYQHRIRPKRKTPKKK